MTSLLLAIIYLAFISLGLPDSLLGAAWPSMYPELQVSVSCAGVISMIIAAGTVISSLNGERLTHRLGTGRVTAFSVATTAAALLGFSVSHSFWALCLWAIPYGLGAGSVDASLNNYVALHFKSRHMSWLHCMWGLGATLGPYIMGISLAGTAGWNGGYRAIGFMQVGLTAVLLLTLPLWKDRKGQDSTETEKPLSLRQIVKIPGAKAVMICFFCYCAVEQTAILWGSSYLSVYRGLSAEAAARFGSIFFIGITLGRGLSGFVTLKLGDGQMIRLGQGLIAVGIAAMLLPGGTALSLVGLGLIGLGCAPIYPSIIHATPGHFGANHSQALIGVEMASAYVGTCLMPPLFGWIAGRLSVALLPAYLIVILASMILSHHILEKKAPIQENAL